MPVVSKSQARFMRGVAGGSIKAKGLSPDKAEEFVDHVPTRNLPERVEEKKEYAKPKKKSAKVWPKRGFLADD